MKFNQERLITGTSCNYNNQQLFCTIIGILCAKNAIAKFLDSTFWFLAQNVADRCDRFCFWKLFVLYKGFVAAHTLPVLYERYEDQVDDFVYKVLEQLQIHYRKLDAGVLSKIPKGKLKGKKAWINLFGNININLMVSAVNLLVGCWPNDLWSM